MFVQYDTDGWTVCKEVLKLYEKGMEIGGWEHTAADTLAARMVAAGRQNQKRMLQDRLLAGWIHGVKEAPTCLCMRPCPPPVFFALQLTTQSITKR